MQISRNRIVRLPGRSGFTLVELLVAASIIIVLAAITVRAISVTADQSKVSEAARTVQSYLEGARNRAIYQKRPVGVRFIRDPNNPRTVSSMMYVGLADLYEDGAITFVNFVATAANPDRRRISANANANWTRLEQMGILDPGETYTIQVQRMPLNNSTYDRYTMIKAGGAWRLTTDVFSDPADSNEERTYKLELGYRVLPNQEPRELPRGAVIDLDPVRANSRYPDDWIQGGNYIDNLDVIFSPSGTLIDDASAKGMLHFLFAETVDVETSQYVSNGPNKVAGATGDDDGNDKVDDRLELGNDDDVVIGIGWSPALPRWPNIVSREFIERDRLVSVNPLTGNVSVSKVNLTDVLSDNDADGTTENQPDGIPDDPFRNAELGETGQ
ncbi:prepilin-type N-terminal cleavage/methylation domain-containing protein [Planctomycetaceae bacterium]|nr:prepilin-type N-terminal cleavage/methylation domain-containing protein [Planctomycetaceae bacterium]